MSIDELQKQTNTNISEKANLIWEIATHLVGIYKPHEYGKVILPLTVLKRFDDALAPTKAAVVAKAEELNKKGTIDAVKDGLLTLTSGYSFYNSSKFDFKKLLSEPDDIAINFEDYIRGFSSNVKDILANFKFEDSMKTMVDNNVLYVVLQEFAGEKGDMSPDKVTSTDKLHDQDLFNEYVFTSQLVKFLPRVGGGGIVDIDDKVNLEYATLKETFEGAITLDRTAIELVPVSNLNPRKPDKKKDTLQNIIDKVNEKFEGEFTEGDRVIVQGIYEMLLNDEDVQKKLKSQAKDTNTEMFVNSLFPDKFQEVVTKCYAQNSESFEKLFTDNDFYKNVMNVMAKEIYKKLRKD